MVDSLLILPWRFTKCAGRWQSQAVQFGIAPSPGQSGPVPGQISSASQLSTAARQTLTLSKPSGGAPLASGEPGQCADVAYEVTPGTSCLARGADKIICT